MYYNKLFLFVLISCIYFINYGHSYQDDRFMHPELKFSKRAKRAIVKMEEPIENSANYWLRKGQSVIKEKLRRKLNENFAKNVIIFLGDGMSIPTISAARAYLGGEEMSLSFDKFPYTGLSKTYCVDTQVADSACSATAYLGGVKANYGTVGVTAAVERKDCKGMAQPQNWIYSIAHHFQDKDKMTGLVTTARVTHASPSGVYAHTADRDWETDTDILESNADPRICTDIATQLVHGATGRRLNVIMGGGRVNFLPHSQKDEDNEKGRRSDKMNLIEEWLEMKYYMGYNASYVSNRDELLSLDLDTTTHLMGLFNSDHMSYNYERNPEKEPSLREMTRSAIEMLSKSNEGYFLFVEGAKIDMGHHDAAAKIALNETIEFSKAIQEAIEMTSSDDTLIIVTSDHAHTMSYSGYAPRGSDIFGMAGQADDRLPYLTLNYANGPGYKINYGARPDYREENMVKMDYKYPGISPLKQETHGGDDVAIFANGPWAHLFTGVMEENVIPQLASFASCVGRGITYCDLIKEN